MADSPPFYDACVPVMLRALGRLDATLARAARELGPLLPAALETRPAPGMLPAGQQVATAVQFTLRTAFPLAGRRTPELRGPITGDGLAARLTEARALLEGLPPADFGGAEARLVRGQAGFADLELPGAVFLSDFGLPNVYFHHAMAHVALKQAGLGLGKADFDGLHIYPDGFSFG